MDVETPSCPQNQIVPHIFEPRGAKLDHLIMIEDDVSSHSGVNKATCDGRSCIRDAHAKRVHNQLQLRVVPFTCWLAIEVH